MIILPASSFPRNCGLSLIVAIAVSAPAGLIGASTDGGDAAASSLTEETKAAINVLDARFAALDEFLAKVTDPAHIATTKMVIDGLRVRREDLLKDRFDDTNYRDLLFDVNVEFQRLAVWLAQGSAGSGVTAPATSSPPSSHTKSSDSASVVEAPVPRQMGTEIVDRMEDLNAAFRRLRRQVANPARNEDSMQLARLMRENAEAAMKYIPAKAEDIPPAERAKFVADYRAGLSSFIEEIGKLEAALKAGNNEEAQRLVASFSDIQKRGHNRFRMD